MQLIVKCSKPQNITGWKHVQPGTLIYMSIFSILFCYFQGFVDVCQKHYKNALYAQAKIKAVRPGIRYDVTHRNTRTMLCYSSLLSTNLTQFYFTCLSPWL